MEKKTDRIFFRLPEAMNQDLVNLSNETGLSKSEITRMSLTAVLNAYKTYGSIRFPITISNEQSELKEILDGSKKRA